MLVSQYIHPFLFEFNNFSTNHAYPVNFLLESLQTIKATDILISYYKNLSHFSQNLTVQELSMQNKPRNFYLFTLEVGLLPK